MESFIGFSDLEKKFLDSDRICGCRRMILILLVTETVENLFNFSLFPKHCILLKCQNVLNGRFCMILRFLQILGLLGIIMDTFVFQECRGYFISQFSINS